LFCPQCGVEYREGFTECADCQVALVAGDPRQQQAEEAAAHRVELATVLESTDWTEVSMASGVLQSAEIPCAVRVGKDITNQGVYYLQVAAENEADARAVLTPPDEADLAAAAEQCGEAESPEPS